MAKGKKTGGRVAGTPNKKTNLFAMCEEKGLNVFAEMLDGAASESDPDKRFNKFKDLAPYLYARKKEVAMSLAEHTPEELLDAAEKLLDEPKEEG